MDKQTPQKSLSAHSLRMAEWLKSADGGYFIRLAKQSFEPSPELLRVSALGFAKHHPSPRLDWTSIDWLSVCEELKTQLLPNSESVQ